MKNAITITQMMRATRKLYDKGERFTHIGIGPMSKNLLKAVLSLAKEKDFPVILIASRNQVDSDSLGGGYVCDFDQKRFVETTDKIAEEIGFDGLCYFCRDHGGPWQRDKERSDALPTDEAMNIARQSYVDDAVAGFHLLHIDPTKDPHCTGIVPLDVVLGRTVQLIESIENERKAKNLPELAYEVGTEETMGGLISADSYEGFIQKLIAELDNRNLPHPLFIVGQTGTLTRLTTNVGHYDSVTAKNLSDIAKKYGMELKEHNGDYLANKILLEHPVIGLGAMNVAPEFGLVETEAYLELCEIENKFVVEAQRSNAKNVIAKHALLGQRWRKWMLGEDRTASVDAIANKPKLVETITQMCGHYTLENAEVHSALNKLFDNISNLGLDPEFYVIKKIKDSIDRYVYCFNLYGTTSKLIAATNE